jgi:hypothetical protein
MKRRKVPDRYSINSTQPTLNLTGIAPTPRTSIEVMKTAVRNTRYLYCPATRKLKP